MLVLWFSLYHGDSDALIVSDGKGYYAWARSVWIDHDVDFENDYLLLYPPDPLPDEMEQRTARGLVINKYPIGMAVLETPGMLIGHMIALLAPSVSADGVSRPYQLAVVLSLLLFYLWSQYLLFRAMLNFGADPFWSFLLCAVMILGTNLLHYIAKEPAMAHAAGVAICNVLIFIVSGWSSVWKQVKVWQIIFVGILMGLLLLVRNSNIFLLPFLVTLLMRDRRIPLKGWLILGVSAALVFSIQPLALRALWGRFLLIGYTREGVGGDWSGIWKTLLSTRHGLFLWHPWYLVLVILSIAAAFNRSTRRLALGAWISFGILVLINGSWWCWWFGDSFGNRAFIETLPMFTLVVGLWLTQAIDYNRTRYRMVAMIVVFALCLLNLYLWSGYLLRKYPHDGAGEKFRIPVACCITSGKVGMTSGGNTTEIMDWRLNRES